MRPYAAVVHAREFYQLAVKGDVLGRIDRA
jgi:hypothetical protein